MDWINFVKSHPRNPPITKMRARNKKDNFGWGLAKIYNRGKMGETTEEYGILERWVKEGKQRGAPIVSSEF
ncbi:MAG: hypothetical protein N3D73_02145 [Candidatus Diapherotrites archaeon]|nr:hypothetical protein [Candidatus Diapherotrites archaeon]